jgi:hypothetical protein
VATIERQVNDAKEAERLAILAKAIPTLSRGVTSLAKTASDQLINQNFETLFQEECEALRAPQLKVDFIGRQGKAQRRKMIGGKVKPSKVLSEGEQKVLAMADSSPRQGWPVSRPQSSSTTPSPAWTTGGYARSLSASQASPKTTRSLCSPRHLAGHQPARAVREV